MNYKIVLLNEGRRKKEAIIYIYILISLINILTKLTIYIYKSKYKIIIPELVLTFSNPERFIDFFGSLIASAPISFYFLQFLTD